MGALTSLRFLMYSVVRHHLSCRSSFKEYIGRMLVYYLLLQTRTFASCRNSPVLFHTESGFSVPHFTILRCNKFPNCYSMRDILTNTAKMQGKSQEQIIFEV